MREPLTKNTVSENRKTFNSMLISGGCHSLKEKMTDSLCKQNVRKIIINLDKTSEYMGKIVPDYEYHISDSFSYADIFSDLTIRDAYRLLRDRASDFGYSESEVGQLLKYFNLMDKINGKLSLSFASLTDMNKYYYNSDVVEDCLEELLETKATGRHEFDVLETSLHRSIGGQLFLENLLTEINFDINFNENGFSLNKLRDHESALLDLSWMHSNSVSDSTAIKALLYDIECYKNPLFVFVNLGSSDVTEIEASLKSLLKHANIRLILIADDIFAQVQNPHGFIKMFSYNAFGSHIGTSAFELEKLFPLITKIEYHNTNTYNRRLFSESLIDIILKRDRTEAIARIPVQRHEIESKDICGLSPNSFILIDNTQKSNTAYSVQTI